ncbi:glucan endo-1,3-beta-glucosidase 7 isoform X1 [Raphanus sativus]|uniref:glucan endo-1,3-beta-D-glucosidase n=1 Tax=Raphanus sativus TaxID=3726 RepID=A0A9W3CEH1_RAPSA|nr:glucan endo-1,3-beta-glucosidase 7 isoform X1 [Raphanus sativus]
MALFTFFFSLLFLFSISTANAQSFIGVNYGLVADNLPSPSDAAKLLQSTSIQKVRLYGADPTIIKSLAGTGVGIVIGVANGDLPSLASDLSVASQWINTNVLPFYPASDIILINVGNEVSLKAFSCFFSRKIRKLISSGLIQILLSNDLNLVNQLLPAMQNVQKALEAVSLGGKIKVSTVHAMTVLGQSDPPSAGSFAPGYQAGLKGILQFLSETGSPFVINPYPFFAYLGDQRPETLSFCLFQPNPGRVDSNTGIKYMNMFDAQVDAVHSALKSMGFENVEVVVAETGWPTSGDNNVVGPSVENAKTYNGNLIAHLRSMVGTPLRPGKPIDTYIFALFDENLKPGPSFERSFGLFKPDLSMAYDIGLTKTSSSGSQTSQSPSLGKSATSVGWCVPKEDATVDQLQASLDWVCGQGIDCGPITPGGVCFEPNSVMSHTAYAMNLYFQKSPENPTDCDFSQTARITSDNPSYSNCVYPRAGWSGDESLGGALNKYVTSDKAIETNGSECSSFLSLPLFMIIFFFVLPISHHMNF